MIFFQQRPLRSINYLPVFSSLLFLCSACDQANNVITSENISHQPGAPSTPTEGTNIYRYLSALKDPFPDKQSLTDLCIGKYGFKLNLPRHGVASAHDIQLPASKEWIEIQQVEQEKYRTIVIHPPSINGIIMQPIEKQVPYTVTENVEVNRIVSGTCVGTEYLLH